jgi:hypothetical protein
VITNCGSALFQVLQLGSVVSHCECYLVIWLFLSLVNRTVLNSASYLWRSLYVTVRANVINGWIASQHFVRMLRSVKFIQYKTVCVLNVINDRKNSVLHSVALCKLFNMGRKTHVKQFVLYLFYLWHYCMVKMFIYLGSFLVDSYMEYVAESFWVLRKGNFQWLQELRFLMLFPMYTPHVSCASKESYP